MLPSPCTNLWWRPEETGSSSGVQTRRVCGRMTDLSAVLADVSAADRRMRIQRG